MIRGMKSKISILDLHLSKLCTVNIFNSHCQCFQINSYLQMSAGQPEEDEITWGSDDLPIENIDSRLRDGTTDFQHFSLYTQFLNCFLAL